MFRVLLMAATLGANAAKAEDCFHCSLKALDRIDASTASAAPEVELREALALSKRACERREDEESCEHAKALDAMLGEFGRTTEVKLGRRLLGVRRCMASLQSDGLEIDARVRVTRWCATEFDACDPGLMRAVGVVSKFDRTSIVAGACAEKACAANVGLPACSTKKPRTADEVFALLQAALALELPEKIAEEFVAALKNAHYPLFIDLPGQRALSVKELDAASSELKPQLGVLERSDVIDTLIQRLGAPHATDRESESWFAKKGKGCVELRFRFAVDGVTLTMPKASAGVCGPRP